MTEIIAEEKRRIFVLEEGEWSIKGRYENALEDDDPISWVYHEGKYSLTICSVSILQST